VFFVHYLRENKKFNNLKDLKLQISKDIQNSRCILRVCKFYNYELEVCKKEVYIDG